MNLIQGWWARLTGKHKPLSPEEIELRRLSEQGDAARQNGEHETALTTYQQGLETARRQTSLAGEEIFLGLIGALQTEQGLYEEAEIVLKDAIATAEKMNDPARRARAMGNLGAHYLQRGLIVKAQNILDQALELARTANDPAVLGLTLANLGGVYLKQNNPSYGMRLLKEGADRLQGVPSAYQSGAVAFAVGQLGQGHLMLNEADRGFRLLTQAIRLGQQANDSSQELRWTGALAAGLFNAGQLQDSLKLYERCEELIAKVRTPDEDYLNSAALNMASIYSRLNKPEMAMGFVQKALDHARKMADRALEARAYALLAELHKANGNPDDAIRAATDALNLYQSSLVSDKDAHIDTLLTLGALHQDKGEGEQALAEFNKALDLTKDEGGLGRAKTLRRIGNVQQERGDLGAALENWNAALDLFQEAGQFSMAARVVCEIGAAKRALSGINMAIPDYERATVLLNNVKDAPTRGLVLSNVANLYTDLGEVETASSFFSESIQLARQVGDRRSESVRLGNYGWFYVATGRPQDAIRVLEEALGISRPMGDKVMVAVQTNNLAQAYHAQRDYAAAKGLFTQSLALVENREPRWKAVFQSNLARTLLAEKQTDEAIILLETALPISRSVNDQENTIRILTRLAEAQVQQADYSKAEATAREAETIARKWGYRKGIADALRIRAICVEKRGDSAEAERTSAEAGRLYAILHDPLAAEYVSKPIAA